MAFPPDGPPPAEELLIELLQKFHNRAAFNCGEEELDAYLHRYARQNAASGVGLTYVAVFPSAPSTILGYFTLSMSRVERALLPPNLKVPPYPVPTLLLARLAIARDAQGLRLGEKLLYAILARALFLSGEAGLWAVEVEALHERAARFYARYGFIPFSDSPLHLFLPIETIRKSLNS